MSGNKNINLNKKIFFTDYIARGRMHLKKFQDDGMEHKNIHHARMMLSVFFLNVAGEMRDDFI